MRGLLRQSPTRNSLDKCERARPEVSLGRLSIAHAYDEYQRAARLRARIGHSSVDRRPRRARTYPVPGRISGKELRRDDSSLPQRALCVRVRTQPGRASTITRALADAVLAYVVRHRVGFIYRGIRVNRHNLDRGEVLLVLFDQPFDEHVVRFGN